MVCYSIHVSYRNVILTAQCSFSHTGAEPQPKSQCWAAETTRPWARVQPLDSDSGENPEINEFFGEPEMCGAQPKMLLFFKVDESQKNKKNSQS